MAIPFSRRCWPLWVALGCWLLVLSVPGTRHGANAAWINRFGASASDFDSPTPVDGSPEISEWTRRFPGDKRVEIYAAARFGGAAKLVERYPNDATILALALRQQVGTLRSNRNQGPLNNDSYPAPSKARITPSPRAEWNQFLSLAARGQQLDPNNSYFGWMRLYGLLATRQDDLARAELARAARLSAYNDPSRAIARNHLAVMRLAYGSPLSPHDLEGAENTSYHELRSFTKTAGWIMETVIADRQNGRHSRALNSAFGLVRLSRVMRRQSYTLFDSSRAIDCEATAFKNVQVPSRFRGMAGLSTALGRFQSDPGMLYSYAKSQHRRDITRLLDTEWGEVGRWHTGVRTALNLVLKTEQPQITTIIAAERFAVMCVRALPSILVFGAIFALLARRFRADVSVRGVFWRGAAFGGALWAGAMICDVLVVYQSEDLGGLSLSDRYFGFSGLFADLAGWIHLGLAGAMICFGLNRAVAWQRARRDGQKSLGWRLKTMFEAPDDGLTRFDFGWLLALAAHATGWALLIGGTLLFCLNIDDNRASFEDVSNLDIGVLALGIALFVSIFLSIWAWSRLPGRRETLRVAARFIAGALAGFFATTSVLYSLVAFATLPLAWQNEARFEREMQVGGLAIARAKVGF